MGIAVGAGAGPVMANDGPVTTDTPMKISLPADNDDYAKLVARAAARDKTVDFRAMRFAYLKSAARQRAGGRGGEDVMAEQMLAAAKERDDTKVRAAAESLLSVNYVDLRGQAFLSMACQRLHDASCAAQADFVTRGLARSIFDSGDGKTCQTGWEVAAIDEEYFVLNVLEVTPKMQSLLTGSPSCDLLETTDKDGKSATFFFRIDAVLEDEASGLKK
jgi:hypothetical protein